MGRACGRWTACTRCLQALPARFRVPDGQSFDVFGYPEDLAAENLDDALIFETRVRHAPGGGVCIVVGERGVWMHVGRRAGPAWALLEACAVSSRVRAAGAAEPHVHQPRSAGEPAWPGAPRAPPCAALLLCRRAARRGRGSHCLRTAESP
jgi:hypothetical protein